MKYLCQVKYVGTDFAGFQFQPGKRTVQGELTKAACRLLGEGCRVTGCSRTDSGVHAEGFMLTLERPDGILPIPPERLPLAMGEYLDKDVALVFAQPVEASFHPRYDAKGKEYRYLIRNEPVDDPFWYHRAWQLRRPFLPDATQRMAKAAAFIVGEHDFAAFMAAGSSVTDTVREVFSCRVEREGALYSLHIAANGFLYNMVRIIAGTLAEVGFGTIAPECVADIIASRRRDRAGRTAPPDGLYLEHVFYGQTPWESRNRTK